MPFEVGQYYTNDQIVAETGGNRQPYLRFTKGKEIVAACLNKSANLRAPDEIWVGRGEGIDIIGQSAQWFVIQCQNNPFKVVPLFIKDSKVRKPGAPRWIYHGQYRVLRSINDPVELAERRRATLVTRVLVMGRVSD